MPPKKSKQTTDDFDDESESFSADLKNVKFFFEHQK